MRNGDLLLAKITPCLENGKQGIVRNLPGGWGYATTEVFPIYPKNQQLLLEFLAYYLKVGKVRQDLASKMEGTTGRQRLPKTVLREYFIPLPPLSEQRAIAYVLRTVQESKEATERVITVLRELKRSLMRHLFTYGPVPVDAIERVELQETEIGPIPAHWRVVRLREVVEKAKQVDPRKKPDWNFKYVDVSSISNTKLSIETWSEISGENAPSRARKLVKEGDIIFATVRPYLKRIAMVPAHLDGHIVSTAFCVIRCKAELATPNYVFFAVSLDNFVQRVVEQQRGSSYPAVTDKDVLNGLIPLPPLSEQQEIARILRSVDERIEAEEKKKSALEALFKTLLHHLMTAKIRLPKEFISRFEEVKQ